MPRPTNKTELIAVANDQWDKMWELINSMQGKAKSAVFDFGNDPKLKEAHWKRDKNLRDVLIHLYEWHELFLRWESANVGGASRHFLPEPYTWRTYGDMNIEFWKKHQNTSYEDAVNMLNESHKNVMDIISSHSDEELFAKYYTWTDGLGSYGVSVTSSHYNWAMKKIKLYIKTQK